MRKQKEESCSRLTASLLQQGKRGLGTGLSLAGVGLQLFRMDGSWKVKSSASAHRATKSMKVPSRIRESRSRKLSIATGRVGKCAICRTLTDDGILVDGGGGKGSGDH